MRFRQWPIFKTFATALERVCPMKLIVSWVMEPITRILSLSDTYRKQRKTHTNREHKNYRMQIYTRPAKNNDFYVRKKSIRLVVRRRSTVFHGKFFKVHALPNPLSSSSILIFNKTFWKNNLARFHIVHHFFIEHENYRMRIYTRPATYDFTSEKIIK